MISEGVVYLVAALTIAIAVTFLVFHRRISAYVVPWMAAKLVMRRSDPDREPERL